MGSAALPIGAIAFLAFFVYRWAGDELARDHRLSAGAANAVLALAMLHAAAVTLSALGNAGPVDVPVALALVVGAPLVAVGAALVATACTALGSRERILGMDVDRLVTDGPYRRARHPFSVGWFLLLLGVAVVGRSGLGLVLVAVLVIGLVWLARAEERALTAALGSEYPAYRDRTPALGR